MDFQLAQVQCIGRWRREPMLAALKTVQAIKRDSLPPAVIRTPCDPGLLEPRGDGRFQMHTRAMREAERS